MRARSCLQRRYADAPAGAPRGAPPAPAGDSTTRPVRFEGQLMAPFIEAGPSSDCAAAMSKTMQLGTDGGLSARPAKLQTTNLGVRSSNLFGRARKPTKCYFPMCFTWETHGLRG